MSSFRSTKSLGPLPEIKYGAYRDTEYRSSIPHAYALRCAASVPSMVTVQRPYLGWKYTATPADRFCRDWIMWKNNYHSGRRPERDPTYIPGSPFSHLYPPTDLWAYYPTLGGHAVNTRLAFADRSRPLDQRQYQFGAGYVGPSQTDPPHRPTWVTEQMEKEKSFDRYKRGLVGLGGRL